jgi:hypothetical protein
MSCSIRAVAMCNSHSLTASWQFWKGACWMTPCSEICHVLYLHCSHGTYMGCGHGERPKSSSTAATKTCMRINDTENGFHTPKFTKARPTWSSVSRSRFVPTIRPEVGTTICTGIMWYLCEMTWYTVHLSPRCRPRKASGCSIVITNLLFYTNFQTGGRRTHPNT